MVPSSLMEENMTEKRWRALVWACSLILMLAVYMDSWLIGIPAFLLLAVSAWKCGGYKWEREKEREKKYRFRDD